MRKCTQNITIYFSYLLGHRLLIFGCQIEARLVRPINIHFFPSPLGYAAIMIYWTKSAPKNRRSINTSSHHPQPGVANPGLLVGLSMLNAPQGPKNILSISAATTIGVFTSIKYSETSALGILPHSLGGRRSSPMALRHVFPACTGSPTSIDDVGRDSCKHFAACIVACQRYEDVYERKANVCRFAPRSTRQRHSGSSWRSVRRARFNVRCFSTRYMGATLPLEH